jgi:hypothetical protein
VWQLNKSDSGEMPLSTGHLLNCFQLLQECNTKSNGKDTSTGSTARAAMAEWSIAVIVLIICFFNIACYFTISSSRLLLVSHRKPGVSAAAAPLTWFAWDLVEASDLVSNASSRLLSVSVNLTSFALLCLLHVCLT